MKIEPFAELLGVNCSPNWDCSLKNHSNWHPIWNLITKLIISIISAAHCVAGKHPSEIKVRAGEWDTQTKNELFAHSDHLVDEVVIHERFYKGGLHNDVALLFLKDSVPLMEHINTICLPPQNQAYDAKRCFVSGK